MELTGHMVHISELFDVQGGFNDVYRNFLGDTPIGSYLDGHLLQADREKCEMARVGIVTPQAGSVLMK